MTDSVHGLYGVLIYIYIFYRISVMYKMYTTWEIYIRGFYNVLLHLFR